MAAMTGSLSAVSHQFSVRSDRLDQSEPLILLVPPTPNTPVSPTTPTLSCDPVLITTLAAASSAAVSRAAC